MKHQAIREYGYHEWANDRVFTHLQGLSDEIYTQEIKSVFPSIQVVLQHIYQTDGMWLSVMCGDNFSKTMSELKKLKAKSEGQSLENMQKLYRELNKRYTKFFDEIGDLDQALTINHPQFGELRSPISEMVKHVVNHGTYHRGNISAMFHQQGEKGVSTDYIFYLYEQK